MSYNKINNITGWIVFLIAFIIYLLTVAPTASFWDCGEFIACSNELEVTHPPGAPLFLLLGRLFSMLAFNQPQDIAFMVNLMSVLSGAFTAMFTCWITMAFALKGWEKAQLPSSVKTVAVVCSGIIAGLSCTFADSIWWNSVEAEVYAMSSFFTACVVWLMMKWSARADQPDHLKWIVLIAYVMGLSLGVHLLNLLTIPALSLIYFFRKYTFSWRGLVVTLTLSVLILFIIQYGFLQYLLSIAWQFERLFTGTISREGANPTGLGMPRGTGAIVFAGIVTSLLLGILIYSQLKRKVLLNVVTLSIIVVLVGFSSYAVIFIRSNADPAVDMNNPENLLTFLSYMKREQYGDRPLVYGPMYSGQIVDIQPSGMRYMITDSMGRYVEDVEKNEYVYRDGDKVLFPRMYEPSKYTAGPFGYINYVADKGENVNDPRDDRPTRFEDLIFFFDYQMGHMYWRYFMWNFVGRASDIQGDGWESGLEPAAIRTINLHNKAKNHYYFIPLFVGLLGLVWQFFHSKKEAWVVMLLFLFTGIAIIIYLNQWPAQPRERDYSFAGSFQTFCIWMGLGVGFFTEWLYRYAKQLTAYFAGGICLIAPVLMGIENWDDHTRVGRYIDREFAYNLLNTCQPNAILFTGGDNDTFPLWYLQEVEGIRTDVRVVNLELLISDWYIDQMKVPHNGAMPVPITIPRADYMGEKGLVIRDFPSRRIEIPIDKAQLIDRGVLSIVEASWAEDTMKWDFPSRGSRGNPYILRKDLIIINILQNISRDHWQRPIYFASMMDPSSYLGLSDFFKLEGLAYRVVPVKRSVQTPNDMYMGWVGQDIMYENLTKNFLYSGLDDPNVYFDEHIREVIVGASYQSAFYRLGTSYANQISEWRIQNDLLSNLIESGANMTDTLTQIVQRNMELIDEMDETLDDESFHEMITKIELASNMLENNSISSESIRMRMKGNVQQINETLSKIDSLITFLTQHISDEALSYDYSDWAILTRIYQTAGMKEQLIHTIHQLANSGLEDIAQSVNVNRTLNPNESAFSAVLMSVQYLMRNGQVTEARNLADSLSSLTGDNRGYQLIDPGRP